MPSRGRGGEEGSERKERKRNALKEGRGEGKKGKTVRKEKSESYFSLVKEAL